MADFSCCSFQVIARLDGLLLATWSAELSASHGLIVSKLQKSAVTHSQHRLHKLHDTFNDCSTGSPEFPGFYHSLLGP